MATTLATSSSASVSVPVLSNTACVASARFSIASVCTTNTPRAASTDSARVNAAGTASANAQGHETTSTASVAVSARCGSTKLQPIAHSRSQCEYPRHETRRGMRSPGAGQTRAFALRACDQCRDAGQRGIGADPRHLRDDRALEHDAAAGERIAAPFAHRRGLAGQQ